MIKKIFVFFIFLILGFGIYYYFKPNIQEDKYCFLKNDGNKERYIELNFLNKNIDGKVLVKGYDVLKVDSKNIQNYDFAGFFEGDKIDVFGGDKIITERVYKIGSDGIIEGFTNNKNYLESTTESVKYKKIKDKKDIIFDEKYIINQVNCNK